MSLEAEQILVHSGGYRDIDVPTILTSGELGIYYANTERTLQDHGAWERHGDDALAMIDHAASLAQNTGGFGRLVQLLAEEVRERQRSHSHLAISGGQRRDWLFSGPVARQLQVPHIALYKPDGPQEGRMEFLWNSSLREVEMGELGRYHVIHIVDLVTEGSSLYRIDGGGETGWIHMLQRGGATVHDVLAVVDRQQGGKEMLAGHGISLQSLVTIDADFLRRHSHHPKRAVAYFQNPTAWSEAYLREHGALAFADAFDPEGSKMPRARHFLGRYGAVLKEGEHWNALDKAVQEKFGYSAERLCS